MKKVHIYVKQELQQKALEVATYWQRGPVAQCMLVYPGGQVEPQSPNPNPARGQLNLMSMPGLPIFQQATQPLTHDSPAAVGMKLATAAKATRYSGVILELDYIYLLLVRHRCQ